jgi:hypothetical protein
MKQQDEIRKEPTARLETGPESLTIIGELEIKPVKYSIKVEGIPVELEVPEATVTTNVPFIRMGDLSLNPQVPCLGFSSERNHQNREDLRGAEARVLVADYPGYGRVIMVNRPSEKSAHLAQDALAHTLAVDVEGNIYFGAIIADGNSNAWIETRYVESEHKVLKTKGREFSLIVASGSGTYADIAARNALKVPAFHYRPEELVDSLVSHIDRNSAYMREYGGSTAQILSVRLGTATRSQMEVTNLNLGASGDLGGLQLPKEGGGIAAVLLKGNDQDLSFEGKLPGYSPKALAKTLAGEVQPLGPVIMYGDGFKALPEVLPGGGSLDALLRAQPREVIMYLSHSLNKLLGSNYDDGSLIIFVPRSAEVPHVVEEVVATIEESVPLDQPEGEVPVDIAVPLEEALPPETALLESLDENHQEVPLGDLEAPDGEARPGEGLALEADSNEIATVTEITVAEPEPGPEPEVALELENTSELEAETTLTQEQQEAIAFFEGILGAEKLKYLEGQSFPVILEALASEIRTPLQRFVQVRSKIQAEFQAPPGEGEALDIVELARLMGVTIPEKEAKLPIKDKKPRSHRARNKR